MRRFNTLFFGLVFVAAACTSSEAADDAESSAAPAAEPAAEMAADEAPESEPEGQMPAPTTPAPARTTPTRTAPTPPPADPEPEPEPEPRLVIPAESSLLFVMDERISTEDNEEGDQFTLSLAQDLVDPNGALLLPAGTQAVGVITEAAESPSSDEPAVLRFTVESVVYMDQLVPLSGQVVETRIEGDERTSATGTAARIGGGAAAGAIIGRVVGGGTREAVAGAVVGAAAGTALWLATRDGHAELPMGATLTFHLAEPVVIY